MARRLRGVCALPEFALNNAELTPPIFRRTLRRMAKKADAKPSPVLQTPSPVGRERDGVRARPSSLLDTRVVYCGDNLEQLTKLPDACDSAFRTPHSAIAVAGRFYYHCDWHASNFPAHTLPDGKDI